MSGCDHDEPPTPLEIAMNQLRDTSPDLLKVFVPKSLEQPTRTVQVRPNEPEQESGFLRVVIDCLCCCRVRTL